MARILLPNGATRAVGQFLNPGDALANGGSSALGAAGTIAGEGSPGGIISPGTAAPIMRQTSAPRVTPGVARTRNTTRPGW